MPAPITAAINTCSPPHIATLPENMLLLNRVFFADIILEALAQINPTCVHQNHATQRGCPHRAARGMVAGDMRCGNTSRKNKKTKAPAFGFFFVFSLLPIFENPGHRNFDLSVGNRKSRASSFTFRRNRESHAPEFLIFKRLA